MTKVWVRERVAGTGRHTHKACGKSAEREAVYVHAGVEEGDLEHPLAAAVGLAHQLVETLGGDHAIALGVGVHAVVGAGWLAIQRDPEAYRLAVSTGSHHQVQVASAEAVSH